MNINILSHFTLHRISLEWTPHYKNWLFFLFHIALHYTRVSQREFVLQVDYLEMGGRGRHVDMWPFGKLCEMLHIGPASQATIRWLYVNCTCDFVTPKQNNSIPELYRTHLITNQWLLLVHVFLFCFVLFFSNFCHLNNSLALPLLSIVVYPK